MTSRFDTPRTHGREVSGRTLARASRPPQRRRGPDGSRRRPPFELLLPLLFLLFSAGVGVRQARADLQQFGPATGLFACLSICGTGVRETRVPPPCRSCLAQLSADVRRLLAGRG